MRKANLGRGKKIALKSKKFNFIFNKKKIKVTKIGALMFWGVRNSFLTFFLGWKPHLSQIQFDEIISGKALLQCLLL